MIGEESNSVDYKETTPQIKFSKIDSAAEENNNCSLICKKRGPRKNLSELRAPRQKFCSRWQEQFPWLTPNRIKESVGFCTICRKELVCKKSHLERHQKSFRHIRLRGFECISTVNVTEAELDEAHTYGYMKSKNDYLDESRMEQDNGEYPFIEVEPIAVTKLGQPVSYKKDQNLDCEPQVPVEVLSKMENIKKLSILQPTVQKPQGLKLPRVTDEDPNDFYYISRGAPPHVKTLTQPKDSFDLFFESVSATAKSLPPKLGAEVKSQVSQLIANFELRAICEKEAQEKLAAETEFVGHSTSVPKVIAANPMITSIRPSNALLKGIRYRQTARSPAAAHYVYAFQPK